MIKIKNRYNDEITFVETEFNKWSIKTNGIGGWGVSGTQEETHSIDPPGGPFISIGYKIPETNKEVIKIVYDKGFYLITKQLEK